MRTRRHSLSRGFSETTFGHFRRAKRLLAVPAVKSAGRFKGVNWRGRRVRGGRTRRRADRMPQPSASDCSICLGVPQSAVTTHCNHRFCEACIQSWISREAAGSAVGLPRRAPALPVRRAQLRGVPARTHPAPTSALRAASAAVVRSSSRSRRRARARGHRPATSLCRVLVYDHAASCSSPGRSRRRSLRRAMGAAGSSRGSAWCARARSSARLCNPQRATRVAARAQMGARASPRRRTRPIHAVSPTLSRRSMRVEHDGATAVRARALRALARRRPSSWRHALGFCGGGTTAVVGSVPDASPPPIAEHRESLLIADFIGEGDDRDADTRLMRAASPDRRSVRTRASSLTRLAPPTRAERAAAQRAKRGHNRAGRRRHAERQDDALAAARGGRGEPERERGARRAPLSAALAGSRLPSPWRHASFKNAVTARACRRRAATRPHFGGPWRRRGRVAATPTSAAALRRGGTTAAARLLCEHGHLSARRGLLRTHPIVSLSTSRAPANLRRRTRRSTGLARRRARARTAPQPRRRRRRRRDAP